MNLGLLKQVDIPDPAVMLVSNGDGLLLSTIETAPQTVYSMAPLSQGQPAPVATSDAPLKPQPVIVQSMPAELLDMGTDITNAAQPSIVAPKISPSNSTITPNDNCTDCGGDTKTVISEMDSTAVANPDKAPFALNFGGVEDWIKSNPWLAIAIAGGAIYLLTRKKKGNAK